MLHTAKIISIIKANLLPLRSATKFITIKPISEPTDRKDWIKSL